MGNCVGCKSSIVSSNCIRTEEEFSFEHEGDINSVLHKLDGNINKLSEILNAKIDKKWIEEEKSSLNQYVQELINEVGVIKKTLDQLGMSKKTYTINNDISNKTDVQLFSLIFKKLEQLENQTNNNTSSLYII